MRMRVNLLAGVPADTRLDVGEHTARRRRSIERWVSRIAWISVAVASLWDIAVTFAG
jgi:hypothetical protein